MMTDTTQQKESSAIPFEGVTMCEMNKNLPGDPNGEEAAYELFSRFAIGYWKDRHMIPGPARIILDSQFESIDLGGRIYGFSGSHVHTQICCLPMMLLLVRQMWILLDMAKDGITFPNEQPATPNGKPELKVIAQS